VPRLPEVSVDTAAEACNRARVITLAGKKYIPEIKIPTLKSRRDDKTQALNVK
jgi:hypothetical protein